jgi:hypothetical protein
VVVDVATVSYGDLTGDGRDVAAVSVICSNDGGTADGQLAFADIVFGAVEGHLRVLGILRPQQPLTPASDHVPTMTEVMIGPGQIIGPQNWYGPNDPTAGGSGRATTTWRYSHSEFRVARTVVLQQPRHLRNTTRCRAFGDSANRRRHSPRNGGPTDVAVRAERQPVRH